MQFVGPIQLTICQIGSYLMQFIYLYVMDISCSIQFPILGCTL